MKILELTVRVLASGGGKAKLPLPGVHWRHALLPGYGKRHANIESMFKRLISIVVKRLAAPVPVHESGSERLRVEVEFPCDYREFHSAVTH